MDVHEKVEQQYKLVKLYNKKNEESEAMLECMSEVIEEYRLNEINIGSELEELKRLFDAFYILEIEKNTLSRALKEQG